jgi:hypothetical protein
VRLYFTFNGTKYADESVSFKVLIHQQLADAQRAGGSTAANGWQTLRVRLVRTPQITLPRKFTTSVTWGDASMLYEDDSYTFLGTYKKLGFNTVPFVGLKGALSGKKPPDVERMLYPGNRTGSLWEGLRFGEYLGFECFMLRSESERRNKTMDSEDSPC